MKQLALCVISIYSFVTLSSTAHGFVSSSSSYKLSQAVFDSAGGASSSNSYRNLSVVGQPAPLGSATSSGYYNFPGFLYPPISIYTLSVAFSGSGSGMVTSTPAGIQCNINCSTLFNAATQIILTAAPYEYMSFSNWNGGGCSGNSTCSITLNGNTTVTAIFNKDTTHAVYLPGTSTYYTSLQAAYDAATTGATIRAWGTTYSENLICNQSKTILIKGGYNQGYTSQTGTTVLNGTLTLSQGTTVVEKLIIQ
jgi:hypothetical protein